MNRKLNIAFVVDAIDRGGVETFLFRLYGYFIGAGHHVTIVACARRGEWWDTAKSQGIRCVCIPFSKSFNGVSHAGKVGKYLASQLYDCVLLNHSKYAQASLDMLPDNVIAIPVIHNDSKPIYDIACSNSNAWNVGVGVSKKVTDTAKRLLSNKPIQTILHGVQSPAGEEFNKRSMLNGKIQMLFVGRISHDQKGVLYLPDIVSRCRSLGMDVNLTIVGDGESLSSLRSRIQQAKISDSVIIKGFLPQDRVYQEMLKHHILLMPSHYEGFGLVALEAQACGCVPIASRLPGVTDEVIVDGRTGMLVDSGDVDAFVKCIDSLNRDPILWHTMSEKGHIRVEGEASTEVMGKAYLKIISDGLLGRYPLQKKRKQFPRIDKSLFTWRDYIPSDVLRAKSSWLAHFKDHNISTY